ncbi:TIGR02270 family protein [Paucibacter sp. R3-3]|uniref:TIGR02270 family protein n=1 Tax=Roseateles agri TaxID=3098619 RepID=A0ABU5DAI8_9BURK|nr:TIGR02270 family protein [Paucibacter sp. R3-3]MDY0743301.1 TIGR02270 family protein [Paucibacter sp. R3-3]
MSASALSRPPIPVVVHQHAEESAMLRHVRSVLVRAPHVRLRHLRRLDDRIAAHLDGLAVAGRYGTQVCTAQLERVGAGEVFACAVRAIDERDDAALQRLIALGNAFPDAKRGLLSAFGWVSAQDLQGLVGTLLTAPDAARRELGIAACRLHRVDPGPALSTALRHEDAGLRSAALRAAAELGRVDLLEAVLWHTDEQAAEAARAACLLGEHGASLTLLEAAARAGDDPARQLLLLAADFSEASALLRQLARAAPPDAMPQRRRIIRACGWLGDTRFVPWLIELMVDDGQARLAGEAFSLITGADLAALDLERKPPEGARMGPSEDPNDDDVSLDEDESLPWPEQALVLRWWQANATRMPATARCFMGAPPSPAHCRQVLREGTQRQRFIAAQHACLLTPGLPLFPVCEPAWRQARRLAAMT